MSRAKLIAIGVVVALVLVIVFQNMQSVETRLLFVSVTMPRALLLLVVFALGFLTGLIARVVRKTEPKTPV
ncbi:MAG: lipopolysaccharide assembly protein LapA domain-containing protein [Planctomycetota bacterium]